MSLFSLKEKEKKNKQTNKKILEAFQALGFFFFFYNFPIIIFNIYFLNIYTSPTFLFPLPFHLPTTSSIFLPPLHFHLPPALYINIIFLFPFIFLYFFLFLFTPSYYKFVTISSILCIVFPHKKKRFPLSLYIFWWIFLFFLHLYFS